MSRDDDNTEERDRRKPRPDDEESSFERAMGDVQPIEGPPIVVPRRGPAERRRRRHAPMAPGGRVSFETERIGQRVFGLAPDADPADLQRLRGGEVAPDHSVDLHGFPEVEARGMVRDTLRRARRSSMRCVKVIHGRGLRSGGDAVLKEALPGWLEEPPLGSWVAAFASSPSGHGGPGSTLVLLKP